MGAGTSHSARAVAARSAPHLGDDDNGDLGGSTSSTSGSTSSIRGYEAAAQQRLGARLDAWELLAHAAAHYPDRLALVDCFAAGGANTSTYVQLHAHVLALTRALASMGVGKGSYVAVMLRNSAEARWLWGKGGGSFSGPTVAPTTCWLAALLA